MQQPTPDQSPVASIDWESLNPFLPLYISRYMTVHLFNLSTYLPLTPHLAPAGGGIAYHAVSCHASVPAQQRLCWLPRATPRTKIGRDDWLSLSQP